MGDVATRTTYELPAKWMTGLLDEEALRARIMELASKVDRTSLDERSSIALEAAERWATEQLHPIDED